MPPFLDDDELLDIPLLDMDLLEEESEEEKRLRLRQTERMRQRKREKRQRERRKRFIKKIVPIGAIAGVVIGVGLVSVFGKNFGVNKTNPEMSIEEIINKNNETQSDPKAEQENLAKNEKDGQTTSTKETNNKNTNTEKINDKTTNQIEQPIPYNFENTANTITIENENIISSHAILIDESTDLIVASKGAKERICPASMTKVLTILVAAEKIKEENLDDTFTMTLEITDYAYRNDCSSVGFLDGEEVTVRDLFYGTILPSGGDAAVGLATYIAGSHEAFVDMMNDKLKELGLSKSAHFTNCVGLYDDDHYCTVYDMAVIMKAAIENEMCKEFLSAHTYTTKPTKEHPDGIVLSNWFLRRIEDKDTGGEVLSAKTGYVVQSRNCAVSYGTFANGTPYICVTAGSSSSWRCIYDHVEIYNRYVLKEEL